MSITLESKMFQNQHFHNIIRYHRSLWNISWYDKVGYYIWMDIYFQNVSSLNATKMLKVTYTSIHVPFYNMLYSVKGHWPHNALLMWGFVGYCFLISCHQVNSPWSSTRYFSFFSFLALWTDIANLLLCFFTSPLQKKYKDTQNF